MKYLILGAITEAGQQLDPAALEAWMAEIGAWYQKYGSAGKQAQHLGLPGHQPVQQLAQRHRLGGQVMAGRRAPGAGQVALVEHQVDDGQHFIQTAAELIRVGHPHCGTGFAQGLPGRDSRCAMAGSAARKAAAISAVVRPQTVRRVSASCDSRASAG